MAEFGEVMRQWKRMCGSMRACEKCPLEQAEIEGTEVCVNGIMSFDYEGAEPIIMSWAAEHPEQAYPTLWDIINWLGLCVNTKDGVEVRKGMLDSPIPADIAEKLGIQPKEAP